MLAGSLLFAAVVSASAQPKAGIQRIKLISADKNFALADREIRGKSLTAFANVDWSLSLKTLHGGKQEGVRLITLDNGKMQIILIPTRGMGILSVTMKDLTLGWKSPVTEIVHPKHVNLQLRGGLGWLEGFNEWLARCGLENTGQAGKDEIINNVGDKQTVDLTLHGKIANIPASEVEVLVQKEKPHRITVRGIVHEQMLFGPKLELVTEVSTEPGSDQFRIEDTITNRGSQPQEYQILYHYNFGKPLLGDGARLHVPVERVTPYNANAARDVKTWNAFAGPVPGYVEQVYLMRPLADKEGHVNVLLHNAKVDRGVVLQYAKKELPYLTLWKNTGHDDDGYVIGIEPGVSFPNARKVERASGRVPKLAGGASHTMRMDFTLLDSKVGVAQTVGRSDAIQKTQAATINAKPGEP
jgi:galactose mutarotase-like enzyme